MHLHFGIKFSVRIQNAEKSCNTIKFNTLRLIMKDIQNSLKSVLSLNFALMIICVVFLASGISGCKAKKEARARAAAEAEMISKAKSDLLVLLSDDNRMTLEEKERELSRIKALGINDPEVLELIAQVENKLKDERSASEPVRTEKDARPAAKDEYSELSDYFQEIVNTRSTSAANYMINETLRLFSSDEVPVLIVINESDGMVDYEEPTTIRKYLEYLKDQKRNNAEVKNLVLDNNGKITEVELAKKY